MSRSYKKNYIVKDKNRGSKRFASKAIRRFRGDVPKGKAYRKVFESYDISDYAFRYTWEEYKKKRGAFSGNRGKSLYRKWYSIYKGK